MSATAAAVAATTTATAAAAAAAARPGRTLAGFIHRQAAALEIASIEGLHRLLCGILALHFDETESRVSDRFRGP